MSLLIAIESFLIFLVLSVESFIAPYASVAPAFYASVASTALHERRYFGIRLPLHNCLAVLVEEVQGLLAVIGVSFSPVMKSFLKFNFRFTCWVPL